MLHVLTAAKIMFKKTTSETLNSNPTIVQESKVIVHNN